MMDEEVELVRERVYQSTVAGPPAEEAFGGAPPCPAPTLEPLSASGVRGGLKLLTATSLTSRLKGCGPRVGVVRASVKNTRASIGREKEQ
jgi:hypothetical protein